MKQFIFSTSDNLTSLSEEQSFVASAEDLKSLAERASVQAVEFFHIRAQGTPGSNKERPVIEMIISAKIILTCIYTQKPLSMAFDAVHKLILCDQNTDGSEDTEFVEHLHLPDETIDLKELASQYLIMGLPDHPHKKPSEATLDSEPKHKPFANLAQQLNADPSNKTSK